MDSIDCYEQQCDTPVQESENELLVSRIQPHSEALIDSMIAEQVAVSGFRKVSPKPMQMGSQTPSIPPLKLPRPTQVPTALANFFTNREAKVEFYENEIYSDRNLLPPYSIRQAQRIFVKGAWRHNNSVAQDALFASIWEPRLKLLNGYPPNTRIHRSIVHVPSNMNLNHNEANELHRIDYVTQPIVTRRKLSGMMPMKRARTKFDLCQAASYTAKPTPPSSRRGSQPGDKKVSKLRRTTSEAPIGASLQQSQLKLRRYYDSIAVQ